MGDLAKTAKIATVAVLTSIAAESLVPNEARADILRDNITDTTNFNGLGEVGSTHFGAIFNGQPDPLAIGSGLSFVGNGQSLSTIEIIWQYGDIHQGLNRGDYQSMDWMVAVYLDPTDYSIEGLLGGVGTAPDFLTTFADPTNADYDQVIGQSGGANNHHAIVDISGLGWNTIVGQDHLAFLIPVITDPGASIRAGLAYSNEQGSTFGVGTDLFDAVADGGLLRRSYSDQGFPFDSAAGRVSSLSTCVSDLDSDGAVGSADLAMLLAAWGTDGADLDGDGVTGSADLAVLLAAWGAC